MKKLTILLEVEQFLKKLQIKQKIFIYAIPIFLGLVILIFVILPVQDTQIQELESKHIQIQNNLKKRSVTKLKKEIQVNEQEILKLKETIAKNKDSLNYFYARLSNLDLSTFDEKKWLSVLNEILKKSISLNISVDLIQNSNSKIKSLENKVVPKKYIEILGKGNYQDILQYISFIENNQYLTEIKNIKISKIANQNKNIEFKVNFTIYGIEL